MRGVSNKCISLQKLNDLIPNNRLKNLTQLTGETNQPIVSRHIPTSPFIHRNHISLFLYTYVNIIRCKMQNWLQQILTTSSALIQ